jgi:hypothetical protein
MTSFDNGPARTELRPDDIIPGEFRNHKLTIGLPVLHALVLSVACDAHELPNHERWL